MLISEIKEEVATKKLIKIKSEKVAIILHETVSVKQSQKNIIVALKLKIWQINKKNKILTNVIMSEIFKIITIKFINVFKK